MRNPIKKLRSRWKDEIVSTKELSNAIVRFMTNCVEANIYTGALQKQLVTDMNTGKYRIRGYNPGDTLNLHFQVEILFEDIRMMNENIKKADRPVEAEITKGKEVKK